MIFAGFGGICAAFQTWQASVRDNVGDSLGFCQGGVASRSADKPVMAAHEVAPPPSLQQAFVKKK
jgi:hypothetical protein